jgi:hypothetical protein
LAALGAGWAWRAYRQAPAAADAGVRGLLYATCWAAVNFPLLYPPPIVPQRPFALGLQVPLALLAAAGLHRVVFPRLAAAWRGRVRLAWLALSSLSNVLLVAIFILVVLPRPVTLGADGAGAPLMTWSHTPALFLRDDEWAGLAWLRGNVPREAVVLASADTSLYIPAWAGQRVIAGHPDHTVRAAEKEAALREFFSPAPDLERQRAVLDHYGASVVWYGPREKALGAPRPHLDDAWLEVFAQGDVTIWQRVGGNALARFKRSAFQPFDLATFQGP